MNVEELRQLKSGDKTLFGNLVKEHHQALLALVTPLIGSTDAEEAVQNAWIKAYRAIGDFEGRSQIRTWLSRIVINEAKMLLRSRKQQISLDDTDNPDSYTSLDERFTSNGQWSRPPVAWASDAPDELLGSEDLAECLSRLLDRMPTGQRALLEMRDSAGLSFDEICNELSVSASNARVLLFRARKELFSLVDHYQETGEC